MKNNVRKWMSHVVLFKSRSKGKKLKGQKCSKCGQVKKIAFFADEYGVVAGLCSGCKKIIEKNRELFPI